MTTVNLHIETANGVLPLVNVENDDPMKAAAIALRQFRRQRYYVFGRDTFVTIDAGTGTRLRIFVRNVIDWLKEPAQQSFLQYLDQLDEERDGVAAAKR